MFKKTLIAAAVVATTATFGAAASTVAVTAQSYGVEYAVGIEQVAANTVTFTAGRDYQGGDIITISYSGATVATMTNAATPVAIVPVATHSGLNVEFLEYDANTVKLLVTDTVTTGDTVTLAGVELIITGAVDAAKVTVGGSGKVSTVDGAKIVDTSTSVDYITFAKQLSGAFTTKFNGVVDVNTARKKFDDGSTADTLVLSNTNATVTNGVTTTGATYTVYGDFSFLDTDGDGTLEAKEGTITATTGTVSVATDFMSASVKATGAVTTGSVGITVTGAAGVVIPDQTFMAETFVSYTDPQGGTADLVANTLAKASAGAWTLNGAKAHVPFLPFGSNYSQSVTVSNTSTQTGGVDLVIYVGDDTVEVEGIATVVAEGVTDISAAVRAAVAAAGLTNANLAFDVIVNAPSANVEVTAVYYAKADGDRLRTK